MRKRHLSYALTALLAAGACSSPEVVVTVEIDVPGADGQDMVARALPDLEIQLLPFDRDAVFDSMTAAYGTPEPEVPQELLDAREEVRIAQEEWQESERRWNVIRDTMQQITAAMEGFSRGESRYVALFREFGDFESQLGSVERQMNSAFENFTALQGGTIRQADSIRILQDNWADEAFSGVGDIFVLKQRASGLPAAADTTDASGVARTFHMNAKLKPGDYWVHARYELTYTELYWNVPITVVADEPVQLRLTRANAQERLRL
jgi:hypothetical protein